MTSRFLLVGFSLAMFFVVGCAASDDEPTAGDAQNVTARPGERDGMCGGIAGIRCQAGLRCEMSGDHPDASGRCVAELVQCMAMPVCGPDENEVEACLMHESAEQCHGVTLCGKTIQCRKAVAFCEAMPACAEGEEEVEACLMHESVEQCRGVTLCGTTIQCRKKGAVECAAVPTCAADEEQVEACLMHESVDRCRGVTLCGKTIQCRKK